MARAVEHRPAPVGLNPAEKGELRALLDKVEPFDPGPPDAPFDVGADPPPGLVEALEYVESCGVRAGLPAAKCYGGGWLIHSGIMSDLRRLAS